MGFIVEHECPQCGAPVELEETNRLFHCPYCDVKNYLFARHYFRLVLPHKTSNKDIIWAPYMRFKGNVYLCSDTSINHRIVDITRLGAPFRELPMSLGFRPQALKMRFVTPDLAGSFLACSLSVDNVLDTVGKHISTLVSHDFFHWAYIGEALSLIYLPMYVEGNKVFDAVTNQLIAPIPGGREALEPGIEDNPRWQLNFMATICPNCGWSLEGEKDSVVLTCSNCNRVWEASDGRFVQVDFKTVQGKGTDNVYLPFWRIKAKSDGGIPINSYADFIRATNQPKAVQKSWENQDMYFWAPAFKIRPRIFLNLSRLMTITQKDFEMVEELPRENLYPVTLPHTEAAQSIKTTLANSMMLKKIMFPLLPKVSFDIEKSTLVYLPFDDAGFEIIQKDMRVSIQKKTLEFGRSL